MTGQWGDAINTTSMGSTGIMSYTMVLPVDINGVPLDIAEIEIILRSVFLYIPGRERDSPSSLLWN